ncbi:unnamed protein product [Gongylonema pulchrum]|uniref:UBA domain-containing protein n=1 Tax=Gongylonema pulchrum TaxID=637853 RepID=A0A183EVQ8_9BILA|nr:unnamed protein product [Gongylonema pulchrum]
MDVSVEMPDEIDLAAFRACGKQPTEKLLPAKTADFSRGKSTPDIDNELCAMGFTPQASRRAVYMTKNTGIQAASTWILNHMSDKDINEEHPDLISVTSSADPGAIEQLTNLGFTVYQARYGLNKMKVRPSMVHLLNRCASPGLNYNIISA